VRWRHFGFLLAMAGSVFAQDEAVFRSDVTVGRIDAQVLNGKNLPVGHLYEDSFVLRYNGKPVKITEFSYEKMPADVLLLLDVSGSMQVQIERLAAAAQRALDMLGPDDYVGVMTFDSGTRVQLKMAPNRAAVTKKLDDIVRSSFGGGTDINGALLEAARYIGKEGRRDARRAIVIVTDDQAVAIHRAKVGAALSEADAVLMALITPKMDMGRGGPMGRRPPFGVPGIPPVILGPGGGPFENATAGTAVIAEESGGESRPIGEAYAIEQIFARIRQWYAIYFSLPDAVQDPKTIDVAMDITDAVRWVYPDAELRYRQTYLTGQVRRSFAKRVRAHPPTGPRPKSVGLEGTPPTLTRRRRAVSEGQTPGAQITLAEPVSVVKAEAEPESPAEEAAKPVRKRRAVEER